MTFRNSSRVVAAMSLALNLQVRRSRLDVSSKLLTLAKVVHSTRPAGGH
jgi:hypothetical protein